MYSHLSVNLVVFWDDSSKRKTSLYAPCYLKGLIGVGKVSCWDARERDTSRK